MSRPAPGPETRSSCQHSTEQSSNAPKPIGAANGRGQAHAGKNTPPKCFGNHQAPLHCGRPHPTRRGFLISSIREMSDSRNRKMSNPDMRPERTLLCRSHHGQHCDSQQLHSTANTISMGSRAVHNTHYRAPGRHRAPANRIGLHPMRGNFKIPKHANLPTT